MTKTIFMISMQRSGTSNLMALFSGFGTTIPLGELYNKWTPYLRPQVLDTLHGAVPEAERDALTREILELRAADPMALLQRLCEQAGHRGAEYIVVKQFPGFLPIENLREMFRQTEVVGLFMTRRPIDAFISLKKANMSGKFGRSDSAGLKPTIDAAEFIAWRQSVSRFFQTTRLLLEKSHRPIIELSYEELYRPGSNPADIVTAKFRAAGEELGPWEPDEKPLPVQDRTRRTGDKVANWEAFSAEIDKRIGLRALDEWDLVGNRLDLEMRLLAKRILPGSFRKAASGKAAGR